MSTRSIVALRDGDGFKDGIYVHSDGYPTGRGPQLYTAVHHFGGVADFWAALADATAPENYWSSLLPIEDASEHDWIAKYLEMGDGRFEFVPHLGIRSSDPEPLDRFDWSGGKMDTDCEWVYVLDPERNTMGIFAFDWVGPGFLKRPKLVGFANFNAPEPDWVVIECGAKYERCGHYASVHFPEAETHGGGRLGTQTFLGYTPMHCRDAIGMIDESGRRWKLTGSGSRQRDWRKPYGYGNGWMASAVLEDLGPLVGPNDPVVIGQRRSMIDVGTAAELHVWNDYKTVPSKPVKGITLIYPPTKAELEAAE